MNTNDLAAPLDGADTPRSTALAPIEPSAMLERALHHHEAGRLEEAQALYRTILQAAPQDADALHLLGVAAHQAGNHALAIEVITQAISIKPTVALYYNNLGSAYRALKQLGDASRCVAHSLALNPDSAEAHYNLGVIVNDRDGHHSREGQRQAEACFRQALVLQPDLAAAHYNLGILLRRAGRNVEAMDCFQQVQRIEPNNVVARFLSAALGGRQIERAPDRYVAGVFDADAEKFDAHLVASLHYDTPQRLQELAAAWLQTGADKKDFLDLGCGTGLAGVAFAPYARQLVGVDLSANMLARARARRLYHRLEHAELLAMMRAEKHADYDAVVAADVFIYTGRLDEIFTQVKRLLRSGGLFAFSVEALDAMPEGGVPLHGESAYRLQTNGRFAHSSAYIRAQAVACGFRVNTLHYARTRLEEGKAVMAWLVLLESGAADAASSRGD